MIALTAILSFMLICVSMAYIKQNYHLNNAWARLDKAREQEHSLVLLCREYEKHMTKESIESILSHIESNQFNQE